MKASFRISLILLTALLALSLIGCKTAGGASTPEPTPPVSETPKPDASPSASPSPSFTPVPTTTPDDSFPERDKNASLTFTLEDKTVTEPAVLISADFGTGIRGYGYNIYSLSEHFDYNLKDGRDVYASKDLKDCRLELRFVPDTTVDAALPTFLDSYFSYKDIEYVGGYDLAEMLYTQGAVASDGSVTYEAYLADADGGVLAFVLCYPNEAPAAAARLHAMLDSFAFNY